MDAVDWLLALRSRVFALIELHVEELRRLESILGELDAVVESIREEVGDVPS